MICKITHTKNRKTRNTKIWISEVFKVFKTKNLGFFEAIFQTSVARHSSVTQISSAIQQVFRP